MATSPGREGTISEMSEWHLERAIKRESRCSLQSADNLTQPRVDFWKRKTTTVPSEAILFIQEQEGPFESII